MQNCGEIQDSRQSIKCSKYVKTEANEKRIKLLMEVIRNNNLKGKKLALSVDSFEKMLNFFYVV
jgi:hypothetical protein